MQVRAIFIISIFFICLYTYGQDPSPNDTAEINALNDKSKSLGSTDSINAIKFANEALQRSKTANYLKGEALAYKNIGMVFYERNQIVETLYNWNLSLEAFEKMGDEKGIANLLSNIGAVYMTTGDDVKALDHSLRALKIAEQIKDTNRLITVLMNIGSIYHNKENPVAIDYYLKVLPLFVSSGNQEAFVTYSGNIGEIYFDNEEYEKALEFYEKSLAAGGDISASSYALIGMGKVYLKLKKYSKSLEYLRKALEISTKYNDDLQKVRSLRGIADVYRKQGSLPLAINYFNQAKAIAENLEDLKVELKFLYKDLADTYSEYKDYTDAYIYQKLYADLKDSLYADDTKAELSRLQFDFELKQKDDQIELKEANLKSEKQTRMGITVTLGILLIGSTIIYRNYLQKVKTNRILDKQKDEIETLLLNILPKEIAIELRNNGTSQPRHIDEASVLFTDFLSFTNIADQMTPDELVAELNECFIEFDNIVEKYGLEKIKTIGDAYMCASNLPSHLPDHQYKIIKAALDIQSFMKNWNAKRVEVGKISWEIRIGVHTGPVVAGVVGRKKYAYDIWGSTVNIASRMESNGTPGKVNISAGAYERVKDRFECVYRGKVFAKNLGDLDMYYVEGESKPEDNSTPSETRG